MKNFKKTVLLGVAFLAMTMTGCNQQKEPTSKEPERDPNEVSVFLLSGQSNMQGNSSCSASNLKKAFTDLGLEDYDTVAAGMKTVQSSVYCAGYGELDHTKLEKNSKLQSYTNKDNQFAGKFIDTVPGFGNFNGTSGSNMGPEFGLAYALKDKATEEKPIFLVKMASNGSGFEQSGTKYNWPVKDANGNFPEINLYSTFAKPFLENNLQLIKDMGLKPVIKGWVWHQGESDCDGGNKTAKYAQRLGDMVGQFRTDFAEYARDNNGDNIAFIDGMVYQGKNTAWTKPADMNAQKQAFADSGENNFIVDTYGNAEEKTEENELKPGSPGGDSMHYNTKSSLRLGMAYGKVILDNGLLDK